MRTVPTFSCVNLRIWYRYGCGDQHGYGYEMVQSRFWTHAHVASNTAWTTIVPFFFCRNLPHVQYELYDACLARDPVTAMNKMGAPLSQKPTRGWRHQRCWERCVTHAFAKKHQQAVFVFLPFGLSFFFLLQSYSGAAGFRPCLEPPIVPASCASCHDNWEIMMYKVHSGMGCSC